MIFDWSFAARVVPILAEGAVVTIQATVLSFGLAMVLGLLLAVARMSRSKAISTAALAVIEFVRGTPLLVQLFFLYFILPKFGIVLPAFTTGVVGLGVHYSAYCAEVYRAGLANVPRGQWEAAIALNMRPYTTFRRVIVPQAIPPIVPALGNYLISLFKETPLLSAIAVGEMMQQALLIGSDHFKYTEPITMAGIFFLVFSLASAAIVRGIERFVRRLT